MDVISRQVCPERKSDDRTRMDEFGAETLTGTKLEVDVAGDEDRGESAVDSRSLSVMGQFRSPQLPASSRNSAKVQRASPQGCLVYNYAACPTTLQKLLHPERGLRTAASEFPALFSFVSPHAPFSQSSSSHGIRKWKENGRETEKRYRNAKRDHA
jgi:hypothetical protein